ncbi:MAG: TRAP transporter large permease [Planctomycetaceae bacterium]|nr:TRAP transporter large permease [Planctomycetaceae bacterium]
MGIVAILFIILLVAGMPLAFAIGIASVPFFIIDGTPLQVVIQKMISSTQSFPLLAVPFFVFAGNLMNETGITSRMIHFAKLLTGHMRGGLAQVSLVLSALMGGVSGSATADAAMECRILGPDMIRQGYSKGFIAAVLAMGGLITATIPPSVGLILYGITGEVSIGRLFIGGFVPGLMVMAAMMITTTLFARKRGYSALSEKPATLGELWRGFLDSIWALLFPVILIVGIRSGMFTASEAGAFAVMYAFVIGKFVYRELTYKRLWVAIRQSANDLGIIMFIIICSAVFGYAVVTDRLPQFLSKSIIGISENKYVVLFAVLTFLFFIGMFMEATANVLILVPIFLPIVKSYGVDPVHFGMLFMLVNTMGGMTPPVGVTMYTACSLLKCPIETYTKDAMPYIIAVLIVVAILAVFPQIVLFLPNLAFG